ncbi:MAG: thiamine phosphate synthase [Puniceicoccales bacterium]|jgi:thiamine-phosphate pyrophosphorylase|nr:thiamine phosphate synthase [Puniceicoccales bacterium]
MALERVRQWLRRRKKQEAPAAREKMLSVVITLPEEFPGEHQVAAELLAAGLWRFHLRKPQWPAERLREWIRAFPEQFCNRLVVHAHAALAAELRIGGVHLRTGQQRERHWPAEMGISTSCHSFGELLASAKGAAYATLGPVFPSISKENHAPQRTTEEHAVIIQRWRAEEGRCPLIALGGISPSNVAQTQALGFDGIAVVGTIWQAENPLKTFHQLREHWTAAKKTA